MNVTVLMITFDTLDARGLASWWAQQFDGAVRDDHDGSYVIVTVPGGGPALAFQKVDDPTPGKNRVHLDLRLPDASEAVQQLVQAGATVVAEHDMGTFAWTVLADPDGNQFCVTGD